MSDAIDRDDGAVRFSAVELMPGSASWVAIGDRVLFWHRAGWGACGAVTAVVAGEARVSIDNVGTWWVPVACLTVQQRMARQ